MKAGRAMLTGKSTAINTYTQQEKELKSVT
jgi:hypothetical protein